MLDEAVYRILRVSEKCLAEEKDAAGMDLEEGHESAVKIARECIVLLKNRENVLPLGSGKKAAFIGEFAKAPRYQGGGSSHINAYKRTSAFDCAAEYGNVVCERGYSRRTKAKTKPFSQARCGRRRKATLRCSL